MNFGLHPTGSDYYIYSLAYPESMGGAIFYIGKGQGYRISDHEREARKGVSSRKCDIIRDIWSHNEQVTRGIIAVFSYLQEEEALMYEWAMINMTSFAEQLANRRSGTVQRKEVKKWVGVNGRPFYGSLKEAKKIANQVATTFRV